jgi:hypothetical protein
VPPPAGFDETVGTASISPAILDAAGFLTAPAAGAGAPAQRRCLTFSLSSQHAQQASLIPTAGERESDAPPPPPPPLPAVAAARAQALPPLEAPAATLDAVFSLLAALDDTAALSSALLLLA